MPLNRSWVKLLLEKKIPIEFGLLNHMEKNFLKNKIVLVLGEQHLKIFTNHPIVMLAGILLFTSIVIFSYAFYSGLITQYSVITVLCESKSMMCLNFAGFFVPVWFVFRMGMLSLLSLVYIPMRWMFYKERWKSWWFLYFFYGYLSILIISSLFASWMYVVPFSFRSWASLFEALLFFAILTQQYWKYTSHPAIERLQKIGIWLTSISGGLVFIGVAIGRLLSNNDAIEFAMLLVGIIGYLPIVVLTTSDWSQRIWLSLLWINKNNS